MRKLLFVSLMILAAVSAFAEPGSRKEERRARKDSIRAAELVGAHRHRTKIKLDGTVLNADQQFLLLSDIDSTDFNEQWSKYVKRRRAGNGLVIAGSGLVGVGAAAEVVALGYVVVGALVAAFSFGQADMDEVMKPAGYFAAGGLAAIAVGGGALGAGIPIRVKADKGMKSICDQYNNTDRRIDKTIILGTTNSGVGISFNF